MAPLAATIAATVVVGVGVALARSGRDRGARRSKWNRRFALLPGEPLAAGMRRMAVGQLDLAIEALEGGDGLPAENALHETRKALKRLRALVRMLEDELGSEAAARENAALRDIAARLAEARDSEVMLATLQTLLRGEPRKVRRRAGVKRLRKQLAADHERARRRTLGDAGARAEVLAGLRAIRWRVVQWSLSDRGGTSIIEPGLRRIYRDGRRRYRRAVRRKGDAAAMHEWRKRVKDLRYAAEMLQRTDPARAGGSGRKRSRRAQRPARLARVARRADELGELLGEDHDLVLLTALIRARSGRGAGGLRIGRRTRKVLLKLIARRRRELRKRSLRAGERLYRRSPGRFVAAVLSAHQRESRRLGG